MGRPDPDRARGAGARSLPGEGLARVRPAGPSLDRRRPRLRPDARAARCGPTASAGILGGPRWRWSCTRWCCFPAAIPPTSTATTTAMARRQCADTTRDRTIRARPAAGDHALCQLLDDPAGRRAGRGRHDVRAPGERRKRALVWASAGGVLLVAGLPQLRVLLSAHLARSSAQRGTFAASAVRFAYGVFMGETAPPWHPSAIARAALVIPLFVVGAMTSRERAPVRRAATFAGLMMVVAIVSGLGIKPRTFVVLSPFVVLICGARSYAPGDDPATGSAARRRTDVSRRRSCRRPSWGSETS